jgi:hypothetical protein
MSAGLRLLLLASRFGPEPVDHRELSNAVAAIDDWPAFLALVERHRLVALVYRSLKGCPEVEVQWLQTLRARVEANTFLSLLQVRELARIGPRLEQQGIPFLVFKGPVLAVQAYGDVALRHAGDLDLVVSPAAVSVVDRLLRELGYVQTYPDFDLTPKQWRVFRNRMADVAYGHSEHGLKLELHWCFFSNPWFFPLDSAQVLAGSKPLLVAGVSVAAMNSVNLLLLLCAHGAKHGWFRLFWLLDVHVLLSGLSSRECVDLLQRARREGVDRMLLQGVLLAQRLYGTQVAGEVLAAAEADTQVLRLVATALAAIKDPQARWGGRRSLAQAVEGRVYLARLRTEWRYRWRAFSSAFVRPEDWRRLPLPDWCFFLYWPLRPLLHLSRRQD